ncbi:MAG TPA: hypothetical protein VHD88_08605, partial [Pyrinomonadaceae bacterium]|nr:hypothetical protein [Pyrinomonadaceae bacterium]
MLAKPTIMKFGGTSVADAAAFERVARIVRAHKDARPVVVVSAMSGVTDALLRGIETAASGDVSSALASIDAHLARHLEVARALASENDASRFATTITERRGELGALLQKVERQQANRPALGDEIVSIGEQLSATVLALVLQTADLPAVYVDARRVVVTDSEHGRANPLMAKTAKRAAK